MLSFSISYPGLIKLPYFADLTQRGDRGRKEAQRQGEDRMTLRKTLITRTGLTTVLPIKGGTCSTLVITSAGQLFRKWLVIKTVQR
jgi:hypothetical protein